MSTDTVTISRNVLECLIWHAEQWKESGWMHRMQGRQTSWEAVFALIIADARKAMQADTLAPPQEAAISEPALEADSVTISTDRDTQLITLAAFRYAVNRTSYMPWTFCEWFKRHHAAADPGRRIAKMMLREITETPDEQLGDDCDARTWRAFQAWLEELLKEDARKALAEPKR